MKYTKKNIIKGAFEVFIRRGYDSTSISVLQEELAMSRGAMYRYFKSKDELFIAVIDQYFFRIFDLLLADIKEELILSDFIKKLHQHQRLILSILSNKNITNNIFYSYTALIIQAAKYYPGFVNRFAKVDCRFVSQWKDALSNSIKAKEIRNDSNVEILSSLFSNVCLKDMSGGNLDESTFIVNAAIDIKSRKNIMDYLYSLIKI